MAKSRSDFAIFTEQQANAIELQQQADKYSYNKKKTGRLCKSQSEFGNEMFWFDFRHEVQGCGGNRSDAVAENRSWRKKKSGGGNCVAEKMSWRKTRGRKKKISLARGGNCTLPV